MINKASDSSPSNRYIGNISLVSFIPHIPSVIFAEKAIKCINEIILEHWKQYCGDEASRRMRQMVGSM